MRENLNSEKIYEEYRDKVFSYVRGKVNNYQDAEDLCEDVFVKVHKNLEKYDESKASVSTWIYHIAYNTVVDYYRTHKDSYELLDNYEYLDDSDEQLDSESLEILSKVLNELPQDLKDIIVLRYYEDLTLKDISERMHMSYGVTKLRHKEALMMMKSKLKNLL